MAHVQRRHLKNTPQCILGNQGQLKMRASGQDGCLAVVYMQLCQVLCVVYHIASKSARHDGCQGGFDWSFTQNPLRADLFWARIRAIDPSHETM